MSAQLTPSGIPATAHSAGVDGIALVRNWPGGWKPAEHAKNVNECLARGLIAPWSWVPVAVSAALTVYVASDALAIGTSPRCRIPINQSGCQRLLDKLGAQLGRRLLMPTPKISDARHVVAVGGNGRVIQQVSIWGNQGGVPEPNVEGLGRPDNLGQNVPQWLRQQERIQKAIAAAGGYPASGVVSTLGKDVVLCPSLVDRAVPGDALGEGVGAKMAIYGWHRKKPPPAPPHDAAPAAVGWASVQQQESTVHTDADNGENGAGGFWDYSSVLVPVLDDCVLNGKIVRLSSVYQQRPELVYNFAAGATVRPIPHRYPLVPAPAGAV